MDDLAPVGRGLRLLSQHSYPRPEKVVNTLEISFPNKLLTISATRLIMQECSQDMRHLKEIYALKPFVDMMMNRCIAKYQITNDELCSFLYNTLYILCANIRSFYEQINTDRTGLFSNIDNLPVTSTLSIDRANLLCRQREHTTDDPLCDNCMTSYVTRLRSLLDEREQGIYERLFGQKKYKALAVWVQHAPHPMAFIGSYETALIREIPMMVDGSAARMVMLRQIANRMTPNTLMKAVEFSLDGPVHENMLRLCVHCSYFEGVQHYWREISNSRKNQMRLPLLRLMEILSQYTNPVPAKLQMYDNLMITILLMKDYDGDPGTLRNLMQYYLRAPEYNDLQMDPIMFLESLRWPVPVVEFWFQHVVNVIVTTTDKELPPYLEKRNSIKNKTIPTHT